MHPPLHPNRQTHMHTHAYMHTHTHTSMVMPSTPSPRRRLLRVVLNAERSWLFAGSRLGAASGPSDVRQACSACTSRTTAAAAHEQEQSTTGQHSY